MSLRNDRRITLYLLLGALLGASVASGQESRATLLGRVVDPSGAVVVGAKVRAQNVGTNTAATSTTNEHGNYDTNLRFNRNQLVLPFPQFTAVSASLPIGYSWFHSMQTRVEKHLTHGVTVQVGWMWSKLMEALSFKNDSDAFLERVISDQDFTHRITVSGIFELPVGQGRRVLGNAHGVLNGVLGGWSVQGWFEGQTGDTLGFGSNTIFNGNLQDIVLPKSQRSVEGWFNVNAGFDRDPARQLAQNIQTFPTRFSGIRADGINNFDLSLFKSFRIRERLRTQVRLETFNTLNHVQLGAPDTTPTSTAFGTITGEKGHGQRQITLAIKVMF